MKINLTTFNNKNSFGAIKINNFNKSNEKSKAKLLIENALETINDTTTKDIYEKTAQKYDEYVKTIEKKKNEIEIDTLFKFIQDRKIYKIQLEEKEGKAVLLAQKNKDIKNFEVHLDEINKTIEKLIKQLEEDEVNSQLKKMRETEAIQVLKAKYKCNEGFSQLGGYQEEKNILYKYFISEIEQATHGQNANVPNSVLFFGPKGNGKTTFSEAFAQEIGANRISIQKFGTTTEKICESFYKKLIKNALNSKELYEKTGQLSVIFIDEIDGITNNKSIILPELKDFINDCYNKYHCITFAATNRPLDIQLPIIGEESIFSYIVSVDPPNSENKQAVFKYYLSERLGNSATDEDYKMLSEILEQKEKETGNLYSNSVISQNICLSGNEDVEISTDDIIKNIKNTEPDIDSEAIEKYNNEMNLIMTDKIEE